MQTLKLPAIRPVWVGLAIAIIAGLLLAAFADRRVTNLGLTAAAMTIVSAGIAAQVVLAPSNRHLGIRPPDAIRVATSGFFTAGFAWVLAGQVSGSASSPARDGSLLLIAGGAMLALDHLPTSANRFRAIAYPVWLLSFVLAVLTALAAVALLPVSNPFEIAATSTEWIIASLAGMLGLTLTAAMAISRVIESPPSTTSAYHRLNRLSGLGWGLLGISFVVHAASIVQPEPPVAVWWYPLMALGALIIAAQSSSRRAQGSSWDQAARLRRMAPLSSVVWVAIVVLACLSAAASVWIGRNPMASRDWALVAASLSMLVVSITAIIVSTLTSRDRITGLSRRVTALMRLSQTDPLTGLANRRSIDERLATEIQRAARFNHPLTIGLIDIDDFKSINDQYGHAAGDMVLRRIASQLERQLRSIDIAGRYGGEEFLMVLPETDIAGARIAAERMLDTLRHGPAGFTHDHHPVTVSIGLAAFAEHGRSAPQMLEAADAALYQAKREGKNRVVAADPGTP